MKKQTYTKWMTIGKYHGDNRSYTFDTYQVNRDGKARDTKTGEIVEPFEGSKNERTVAKVRLVDSVTGQTHALHLNMIVWKRHVGPIPSGFRLDTFDGNPMNCAVYNIRPVLHDSVKKRGPGRPKIDRHPGQTSIFDLVTSLNKELGKKTVEDLKKLVRELVHEEMKTIVKKGMGDDDSEV